VTIYEFADIIDQELTITRYSNQNNRWSASFRAGEVKDGPMLVGEYGNGHSADEAIENYLTKIRGKKVVFHAMSDKYRCEYVIPKDLVLS